MATNNITELNQENFNEVLRSSTPVLIDFWASWCGPCKMLAPIIEELANDYEGRVVVCKMDVDENTDIAKKYKVMSIPTVLIFKNGEEVSRDVGVKAKNVYEEKLNEIL